MSETPFTTRPMIYVAGFYSANPTHGLRNAADAWEQLCYQGWLPLVPHTNMVLDAIYPEDEPFWYEYDLGLLMRCDAVYVCEDKLTRESVGVLAENAAAIAWGIPVVYTMHEAATLLDDLTGADGYAAWRRHRP